MKEKIAVSEKTWQNLEKGEIVNIPDQDGKIRKIQVLISSKDINLKVKELAKQINEIYPKEKIITLLCVLKGANRFSNDISKELGYLGRIVEEEYVGKSSYGSKTESSGFVKTTHQIKKGSLKGKSVLIVEDIADTRHTLKDILDKDLTQKGNTPENIKICVFLNKESKKEVEVPIDFEGFKIPPLFVIGGGLDLDEYFRNLPFIGVILNP